MKRIQGLFKVDLAIFNCEILVFFDKKHFCNFVNKIKDPSSKINENDGTWRSVYRRIIDQEDYIVRILCIDGEHLFDDIPHEVAHVIMDIMDDKSIPISLANTEVMAYLIGYTCEKIFTYYLTKVKRCQN